MIMVFNYIFFFIKKIEPNNLGIDVDINNSEEIDISQCENKCETCWKKFQIVKQIIDTKYYDKCWKNKLPYSNG